MAQTCQRANGRVLANEIYFRNSTATAARPRRSRRIFDCSEHQPQTQLSAILQRGGGLQLAYKLMKSGLDTHTRILFFAEQGCWNHYTDEVTNTKTPQDAFNYSLRQCDGGWKSESHIWETLKLALSTADNLRSMDLPFGESESATKLLMLAWHIVSQRLWSLCSKHNCPPECCVGYNSFPFLLFKRFWRPFGPQCGNPGFALSQGAQAGVQSPCLFNISSIPCQAVYHAGRLPCRSSTHACERPPDSQSPIL